MSALLATFPIELWNGTNTLYYYSKQDKKSYIIIAPSYRDTKNCYRYDICEDKWSIFTSYPDGFNPDCHGSEIDIKNELLYIFCGVDNIFGIFNLKKSKWKIKSKNNDKKNSMYGLKSNDQIREPASTFIYQPIHQLHVFDGDSSQISRHIKYIYDPKRFIQASTKGCNNNKYVNCNKMCYISAKKILLVIGGTSDDYSGWDRIYYTKIRKKENNNYKWKLFDCKYPYDMMDRCHDIAVVFGMILIVWDYSNGILCLDFGEKELKWIKCDIQNIKCESICFAPIQNRLHFISTMKKK
eukprot:454237_1